MPEVLTVYRRLFVRAGLDVHTAENGLRALDVIRRGRPAVVVTGGVHDPAVKDICHAVLEKPCAPDVLLETVLRAIGTARPTV